MSQTPIHVFYSGHNSYGQLGIGHQKSSLQLTECKYDQNINFNIKKIVCGDCFRIYVTMDGEYFSAGFNNRGTCAVGNFDDRILNLTKITHNICNIKNVFGGVLGSNLLWITYDGLLYINGWNENQQIGIGSKISQNTPILIEYFKKNNLKVIYGRSGFRYNMVICDNGSIYTCGYGDNGCNGLGSQSVNIWTKIESLKNINIIDIKSGDYYSLFLSQNGNVYACGVNYNGELGLGHNNNDSKLYPTIIPFFEKNNIEIKKIECGWNHSIAIDKTGRIYSWGSNEFGQCGFDDNIKKLNKPSLIQYFCSKIIIDIQCGGFHSVAITKNNKYFIFGSNKYGECGDYKIGMPYLLNKKLKSTQNINNISLGYQTTILLISNNISLQKLNDCMSKDKQISQLKKENASLRNEILKLKSQLKSSQDDQKEIMIENMKLKSQIKELNMNNIDTSKYLQWDHNDILIWILSLNNEYKIYENKLKTSLEEECVIGKYLPTVDKADIKGWGIKHFQHKNDVFNSIQKLINNNQQQNANNNLNEGSNAITEYI